MKEKGLNENKWIRDLQTETWGNSASPKYEPNKTEQPPRLIAIEEDGVEFNLPKREFSKSEINVLA